MDLTKPGGETSDTQQKGLGMIERTNAQLNAQWLMIAEIIARSE